MTNNTNNIDTLASKAINNLIKVNAYEVKNSQAMAIDCLTVALSNNITAQEKIKELVKTSKNIKNRLSEANTIVYVLKHKQSLTNYSDVASLVNALVNNETIAIQALYSEALPIKKAIKAKISEKNLSKKALNEALEEAGVSANEALLLDETDRQAIQAAIIAKKLELQAEKMQAAQVKASSKFSFEQIKAMVNNLTIEQKQELIQELIHQFDVEIKEAA